MSVDFYKPTKNSLGFSLLPIIGFNKDFGKVSILLGWFFWAFEISF